MVCVNVRIIMLLLMQTTPSHYVYYTGILTWTSLTSIHSHHVQEGGGGACMGMRLALLASYPDLIPVLGLGTRLSTIAKNTVIKRPYYIHMGVVHMCIIKLLGHTSAEGANECPNQPFVPSLHHA